MKIWLLKASNSRCAVISAWIALFALAALLVACAPSHHNHASKNEADDDAAGDDDSGPPSSSVWDGLSANGPAVGTILGMATEMNDSSDPDWHRDFEISKLQESGLMRLRASVDWGDVEPTRGDWHIDARDPFVNMILDAGIQFDGRLCYGVDWATPPGNDSGMDPADFAGYAGAVAAHYCGTISSYEIWNEENISTFWKPRPDPDRFGLLMKAAALAIRQACPGTKVVFGGLSCFEADTFTDGFWYFLERVRWFHPDIGDYFDVLAIHPYTLIQYPSPEWSLTIGGFEWPDVPGQIRAARERLAAMGHPDTPIWITEYGWPSLFIGQEAQAEYLVRGALLAIAEGAEAVDWYTFWDNDGHNPIPTEDYFGLFTWPDAPGGPKEKPAFRAAKGLTQVLGAAHFAKDISSDLKLPVGVYGLAFIDDNGRFYFAGWDSRPGMTTNLNLPSPPAALYYKVLTDEGAQVSEGGAESVAVKLSEHVLYVRFDAGK